MSGSVNPSGAYLAREHLPIIQLPECVAKLVHAHAELVESFAHTKLRFTLDGRLVGDIAEATVAEAFGLQLCERRTAGADAFTLGGRSVQIKASGIGKGPAFTRGDRADHLIFVLINFVRCEARVAYNGPERPVRDLLPDVIVGTKRASLARVLELDAVVDDRERLALKTFRTRRCHPR